MEAWLRGMSIMHDRGAKPFPCEHADEPAEQVYASINVLLTGVELPDGTWLMVPPSEGL